MLAAQVVPHPEVIRVDVSRSREGVTFALYPLSKDLLRSRFERVRLWPRVFIARETEEDFRELEGSLQAQVIELLTGLPRERLRELDVRVEFVDVRPARPLVIARFDP